MGETPISSAHLQLLKQAFWSCTSWRLEGAVVSGESQGFKMWLGKDGHNYAGSYSNEELGIQGDLSEHVVRKLYSVACARVNVGN